MPRAAIPAKTIPSDTAVAGSGTGNIAGTNCRRRDTEVLVDSALAAVAKKEKIILTNSGK